MRKMEPQMRVIGAEGCEEKRGDSED